MHFKKDPVTPEMLKALVESKITDTSPSISDLRLVALCLLGYAGFFPFYRVKPDKRPVMLGFSPRMLLFF